MKIASVVLDIQSNQFNKPLNFAVCKDGSNLLPQDYFDVCGKLESNLKEEIDAEIGCSVVVPFGKQLKLGFIIDISDDNHYKMPNIKPILKVASRPYFSKKSVDFAKFLSEKYLCSMATALRMFIPVGLKASLKHNGNIWTLKTHQFRQLKSDFEKLYYSDELLDKTDWKSFNLTDGQENALNLINNSINDNKFASYLLNGVTSSGKTEVYLRSISNVVSNGKTALVLVPEISLTPQIIARFKSRFGSSIALIHSKMTPSQRYNQFCKIKSGKANIVIGARSALFSPIENIGIIVVDEEHEASYKQDKNPRYVTRDCAEFLAKQNNAVLVLGSATPSLESLFYCQVKDDWHKVDLLQRTNLKKLPKIELVNMANEFKSGNRSLFSSRLKNAIIAQLSNNNKVLIFHNRRGFSNYVFCRNCGYTPVCDDCSTNLTYHEFQDGNGHKSNSLICHHCNKTYTVPVKCPNCDSHYIAKYGAGTQNVEDALSALLVENKIEARIIRMDADTTSEKLGHQKCLIDFAKPGPAVLLGTQMIAKGLDFDDVTLVGIVLIDTNLALPDYRTQEKTFNLIQQVAGRSGRADQEGKVIIQTYNNENDCIELACNYDVDTFHSIELAKRQLLHYPPYYKLINVVLSSIDEDKLQSEASRLFENLNSATSQLDNAAIEILPPTFCVIEKIRKHKRMHILIKYQSEYIFQPLARCLCQFKPKSGVKFTIDVDPISLL